MTRRQRLSVLVTGGPTRAYVDDVRYLSNYSTGELAFEVCRELVQDGFEVHAVIGPSHFPFEGLKLKTCLRVETLFEMRAEILKLCHRKRPFGAVFAAAVLDFIPARRRKGKSSSKKEWTIRLVPAPKIIDEVGRRFPAIHRIGFKLEARPLSHRALKSLGLKLIEEKKLDALCMNFLSQIRGRRHRAYLFRKQEARPSVANNKLEIARWISRTVWSMQSD